MLITLANMATWMVSSRDEGRVLTWASIGAAAGVYLFYRGFRMLQFKQLILNTPFSKVRSASMGLVELGGAAVGPNTIPAGITGDPCYYYRATAWELKSSGNRRDWKQVANESLFVPFFIEDETGKMLIDAQGADMDVHRNFKDEFGGSFLSNSSDMPMGTVEDFLTRYGISGRHVRLEEYCIKADYPLFVLGTLGENHLLARTIPEQHLCAPSSSINLRWSSSPAGNRFSQLFGVPGAQTEPVRLATQSSRPLVLPASRPSSGPVGTISRDASSWSSVSMDEVHKPMAIAQSTAMGSIPGTEQEPDVSRRAASPESGTISLPDMPPLNTSPGSEYDLNPGVAINKGGAGAPFAISCESQRDLVRALNWKSTACIWGGPALTVACVYILAFTLGWL
jgi:E3 Ubiquitin ligase